MRRVPVPSCPRRRSRGYCWLLAALIGALAAAPAHAVRQTEELMISPGRYSYRYLLYLPPAYGADTAALWPLMIMLHGSGAVGQPMGVMSLAGPGPRIEQGRDFPAVVVSPQCNIYNWDPVALGAFIDDVAALYRIDRDRIYVTGMSMGGYGTWNLATTFPERYAAIAPVCGGGNPGLASRLRDVPVWAFHGALDTTVPLVRSQEMIDGIRNAGGEPRLTVYPNAGHDAWTPAYNDEELYTWMFAQNLSTGPEITRHPAATSATAGTLARLSVAAHGTGLQYQWLRDGFAVAGTNATLEWPAVAAGDAGDYSVVVTNSRAASVSRAARLTVLAAPAIVRAPQPLAVAEGECALLQVEATGGELNFAWRRNGQAVPGAHGATLSLGSARPADAGAYSVVVTNPRGEVATAPVALTVGPASPAARIVNLSVRAQAGAGDQTLIIGLTVGGPAATSALPVLLQGVGPALRPLGVSEALTDPAIVVFDRGTPLARNGDWGDAPLLGEVAARVGATPLPAGGRDAAVLLSLPPGGYTMHASSSLPGRRGIALLECYDAGGAPTSTSPELVNVAARAAVGAGDGVLVAGFVVSGPGTRRVLVRALGPALAASGVTGLLRDPQLRLFRRGTLIAENNDWSGGSELREAFSLVGATAPAAESRDAALVVTLPAGIYSAHVSAADGAPGVGLVEVYALP
jgi:predicted esterase